MAKKVTVEAKRQVPVCSECNSFDVRFDAYAGFNPETGGYEHISDHGNPVCEDCGGECKADWVPFIGKMVADWNKWRAGGPSIPVPNVWRLEVDIHATMYVRADTAEEAKIKALKHDNTGIELRMPATVLDGVQFCGLPYDDKNLPDVSLSPAMTLAIAEDVEPEDAND